MQFQLQKYVRVALGPALIACLATACADGFAVEGAGAQLPADDGMLGGAADGAGQMTGTDGMGVFMGVACTIGLPEPCQCMDGQIGLQTCEANAESPSGAAVTGCGMCGMALGNLPGDDGAGSMDGAAGSGAMGGSAGSGSMEPGVMTPPPDSGMGSTRMCDPSACPAVPLLTSCCKTDGSCGVIDLLNPGNCI